MADVPFLVLDLGLDVVDGVGGLHLELDVLAGECLDEDLYATTKTKDKVKGQLLLAVTNCGHLQAACWRRSGAAGQVGY